MHIDKIISDFLNQIYDAERPTCISLIDETNRWFDATHVSLKNLYQTLAQFKEQYRVDNIQLAFAIDKDLTLRFQCFDPNRPIQTLIPVDERQPSLVEAVVMGVMQVNLNNFSIEKIHCLSGIAPQQLVWLFLLFHVQTQECLNENQPYCYFSPNLNLVFGDDPQVFILDSLDILMACLQIINCLPPALMAKLYQQSSKIIRLNPVVENDAHPSKKARRVSGYEDENHDEEPKHDPKRRRHTYFVEDNRSEADELFDLPPGYNFGKP